VKKRRNLYFFVLFLTVSQFITLLTLFFIQNVVTDRLFVP